METKKIFDNLMSRKCNALNILAMRIFLPTLLLFLFLTSLSLKSQISPAASAPVPIVVHPLIGPAITPIEASRYSLFSQFNIGKLRFETVKMYQLSDQRYELRAEQLPGVSYEFTPEMIKVLQEKIDSKAAKLLSRIDFLEKRLQTDEQLRLKVRPHGKSAVFAKAIFVKEQSLLLELESGTKLELPKENIQMIAILDDLGLKIDASPYTGYQVATNRHTFSQSAIPMEMGRIEYQNIVIDGHRMRAAITPSVSGYVGSSLFSMLGSLGTGGRFQGVAGLGLQYSRSVGKGYYVGADVNLLVAGTKGDMVFPFLIASKAWEQHLLTLKVGGNLGAFSMTTLPIAPTLGLAYTYDTKGKWSLMTENFVVYNEGDRPPEFNDQTIFSRDAHIGLTFGLRRRAGKHAFDFGNMMALINRNQIETFALSGAIIQTKRTSLSFISPYLTYSYLIK